MKREPAIRDAKRLQQELDAQVARADIGELVAPVLHEVNNFLNSLLMHLTILEPTLSEPQRADTEKLRRHARTVAGVIKQFQQYRGKTKAQQEKNDLNKVIKEVVNELTNAPPVQLKLHRKSLEMEAPLADIKRLCRFLITNAVGAAASTGGHVMIRTDIANEKVVLTVEDSGPSIAPEQMDQLFLVGCQCREGTNTLEMAACESLTRRLGGRIVGANRPEGGAIIRVEF